MPTLTSAMAAAVARDFNEPGVFVQMDFASTIRLTDRDATVWNGFTWQTADINAQNLGYENGTLQSFAMQLRDANNAFSFLLLQNTKVVVPVTVWIFDASALAVADPVRVFDGIIDKPSGDDMRNLTIPCRSTNPMIPKRMLINVLPRYMFAAEGNEVFWRNGKIKLNRRGEYS